MAGPDTKNTETPYPMWGFGPPSPEPDTKKLDALLASLNGSAERFQTLWFSFLGLTLYFAIAALTTTHKDLLLGEPKTLPLLNIPVPLLPFYIIAPLLYLVFHFYLLMMLALLARTAAEFDKQLRTTLPREPERERYRAQVGNALFLQLLVGMKGERTGVNALLMGLIALITIVLAPLATLVLMQMMFLPYHHLRITWWHRGIVVADLVLIVVMTYRCFFPRGVTKAPLVLGALSRKPRWAIVMAFCVLLAGSLVPLVDWLSFRQGRWAGEPRPSSWQEWARWMGGKPPPSPEVLPDYAATKVGVVFSWFPDRLKLPNEPIVGKDRLEEIQKEIASRGGGFLPSRKFEGRDLQAADLSGSDLRGVSLEGAIMRGTHLEQAWLDDADLAEGQLQGANLQSARLGRASLNGARLQGAFLAGAQMPGAELNGAELRGADLGFAHLQGADVSSTRLQGADLRATQLRGADLGGSELQGADLGFAQLQGADLTGAQLQGANLRGANLADGELDGTFVFGTDISDTDLSTSVIRDVIDDRVKNDQDSSLLDEPLTSDDVDKWIRAATQFQAATQFAPTAADIIKRFARLKVDFKQDTKQVKWSGLEEASRSLHDDVAHGRRLETILGDIACEADGAPYAAQALLIRLPSSGSVTRLGVFNLLGDQLDGLRNRMKEGRKNTEKCPGVAGFTEHDWRA